jgi:hypothetical protein
VRRRGRPTRLTTDLQDRLVATVREVGSVSLAARLCGLHPGVVNEWVARGDGCDRDRPQRPVFAEFATDLHKAEAEFEIERLELINAAAEKPANWRAAAWQLERWDPARYGRRRRVEMSGMVPMAEVRALLSAVLDAIERWVPEPCREVELANLIAVAQQIGGGALGACGGSGTR